MFNQGEEIRLVIGAGEYDNNPGWMQTQEQELNLLHRGQWAGLFLPNSILAILAEHVWEHLDFDEGVEAAKICFEFLKPGGSSVAPFQTNIFQMRSTKKVCKSVVQDQLIIQLPVIK